MTDKAKSTIHIKWVRSGIGFPRRQKTRVKSLGLGRLNQVVERPDTPQIRGLVESIPHLVEIVEAPAKPAWMSVPEVTILPPDPAAAPAPKRVRKPKPVEAKEPEAEKVEAKPAKTAAHAEHAKKEKKSAKASAAKHKKDEKEKKSKAAKAKPAKKTKK
ncbi:MAG TPA: 50S ribosomal protein L30 [Terriglobia bacterium]|nr:50S ribosomal protein L30 [Terriglobia bacterium]